MSPLDFSTGTVAPIQLGGDFVMPGTIVTVSGWGAVSVRMFKPFRPVQLGLQLGPLLMNDDCFRPTPSKYPTSCAKSTSQWYPTMTAMKLTAPVPSPIQCCAPVWNKVLAQEHTLKNIQLVLVVEDSGFQVARTRARATLAAPSSPATLSLWSESFPGDTDAPRPDTPESTPAYPTLETLSKTSPDLQSARI